MRRIIENQFPLGEEKTGEQLLVELRPGGGMEQLTYGYLGGNEKLEEVIANDERTLKRLRLTHEQFAKTIEDIFEHIPAKINGNQLYLFGYIHSPICPWGDFCAVSPFDYSEKITEIWLCSPRHFWKLRFLLCLWNKTQRLSKLKSLVENDWIMVFSDLHPHLIRDHRFFQGHHTPYRVDPERFVRFMGRENIYPYSK